MSVAQTVKLSSGHAMPLFGLGTWKSKPGEVTAAVKHAIKSGYRWVGYRPVGNLAIILTDHVVCISGTLTARPSTATRPRWGRVSPTG